jgi:hypothetical protein
MWFCKFLKLSLISCLVVFFACSKTPEEKLEKNARDFVNGKIKDISIIEEDILKVSSKLQITKDFSCDKRNAVIISNGSLNTSLNFLYPFEGNVYPKKIYPALYSAAKDQFVVSDGQTVELYSENGVLNGKKIIGDDKLPILAIALVNNNIIFLRDMCLWEYDIKTDSITKLSNEKFSMPYDKMFNVSFVQDGEDIGIMIGCAGSYFFSVFDYGNKKMLVSNVKTSTSKVSLVNRKIKYLSAVSSGWQLCEIDAITKKKSLFQIINEIEDVEIFDDIVFVEHDKKLYIYDLVFKKIKIPFNFRLKGSVTHDVFIIYSGKVFVCDPIKFRNAIDLVSLIIPDLFEEEKREKK